MEELSLMNEWSTYKDGSNLADSRQHLVVKVSLHDLPFGGIPSSLEGSHELAVLLCLACCEFDGRSLVCQTKHVFPIVCTLC